MQAFSPDASPPDALGPLLRGLRSERRLTQTEAARVAGLGRVTLARWESGAQRPRVFEMEMLLDGLRAGPAPRRAALVLLGTAGAVAVVRAEGAQAGIGPAPAGGDLLRAMRARQGLDREDTAVRVGVKVWTLRRWELGDSWPDPDRLRLLCAALGAHPGEADALASGPLAALDTPAVRPAFALSESVFTLSGMDLDERLTALHLRISLGGSPLTQLECLALEAAAWPRAIHSDAGRWQLSNARYQQAFHVSLRPGHREAARLGARALDAWPERYRPEPFWFFCGVLTATAHGAGGTPADNARAGRRLDWLRARLAAVDEGKRRTSPKADAWGAMAAWIAAMGADCLARAGDWEAALSLGTTSCRIAADEVDAFEERRQCHHQACLLLGAGRPVEALEMLEGIHFQDSRDTLFTRAEVALALAEAHLATHSPQTAQAWLDEGHRLIRRNDLSYLLAPAARLAAQF